MRTSDRVLITTRGVAQTRRLGRRLAALLLAGDVLLLQGDLGAGKTALAQGIGAGLGVMTPVASPTFVLLARHDPPPGGGLPLFHADLYRLTESEQVEELALAEQASGGVLLVEWPERGIEALPAEHLLVRIEPGGAESERRFTFVAMGGRYRRILDALAARRGALRV
ncbi:MAG: tRNA (adenosine(37)-N6)-threonylcarbamoyltransferase complex ATPase subunit type 1 TsaE [Chloroflexi bacterium]|nr:tRNA (adenosine(37)-N6)-threonylcarbamoyltransferase complex ATPase subunit type 1 TsaE [Chloroflexota bacterium]